VGLYALLTLGALGIIYPFLIVLGQTLSDSFDLRDNAIVPHYLKDRNELALKYVFSFTKKLDLLASRHNRNSWSNQVHMRDDADFFATRPEAFEAQGLDLDSWEAVIADLNEFKAASNPCDMMAKTFRLEDHFRPFLSERYGSRADDLIARVEEGGAFPEWIARTYPDEDERGSITSDRDRLGVAIMNHDLRSDYLNYYSVEVMSSGNFTVPFWRPGRYPKDRLWSDFKKTLPPEQLLIIPSDTYWHTFLKLRYRTVAKLNEAWGTSHEGFYGLHCQLARPAGGKAREDWDEFVVKRWPRRLLRVSAEHSPEWRKYVRAQLVSKAGAGDGEDDDADARALAMASGLVGRKLESWDDLEFPPTRPADETLSRYWCEFASSGAIPPTAMELRAPEVRFREFLRGKYRSPAKLNAAWGTSFANFDEAPLPLALADYAPVRFAPSTVRGLFVTESYRRVGEYMAGRGRAAWNTLILVVLSLLSALTINPIAAYSLSRFPMKSTQKILIFFLATMAFPAEVAMIPNFLLLRDLGLLNTYAALILPTMANGFAIFLLKGFFDSLPRELYQAAEIDGASEIQIFRMVAMPLVTPILAFIGLSTFVLAYSSFMWAFVICPKEEMWTLMVWVYDFQMKNPGNNYVMAATVLVSIPPLIVFFFANRIIMKGIVIPSLK
jgi:ABC-type glycerol-3-phosphate transport system permease component